MAHVTILVVDDEPDIQELLRITFKREGYEVFVSDSGEKAIEYMRSDRPDLVVLDLMLPGIDGLEVCKIFKADPNWKSVPILMLSAKGEEADVVSGLELGAEDYVTKPFSSKELVARIRRILRRQNFTEDTSSMIRVGDMVIDASRREVKIEDEVINLTFTEFNILCTLSRRPGVVFTRYQIVDSLHGRDYLVTDRAVDVQVVGLRRKLGRFSHYIETVRGVGYRIRD